MATVLKKLLKEGHALLSQEHGANTLYDVLKALVAATTQRLSAFQATIATGSIGGFVAEKAFVLKELKVRVGVCGTVTDTVVQVHKNGTLITGVTLTVAHTDPDPTVKTLALDDIPVAIGDAIELVVSTAPTGGSDLAVTLAYADAALAVE